jgi:hypothetical protein
VVWVEWRGAFVSYFTDGSAGLVLSERMSVQMCLNVLEYISREGEDEKAIELINRLCGNNITSYIQITLAHLQHVH